MILYLQMSWYKTLSTSDYKWKRVNQSGSAQRTSSEQHPKRKSDQNFVRSASILYNILSRHAQYANVKLNKSSLTYIYWQYFVECNNEKTNCTWRILYLCGSSNPYGKLTNRYHQNCTNKWTLNRDEGCPWNPKNLSLLLLIIINMLLEKITFHSKQLKKAKQTVKFGRIYFEQLVAWVYCSLFKAVIWENSPPLLG